MHNGKGRFPLCRLEVCGFHVWINQVQMLQKTKQEPELISGSQLLSSGDISELKLDIERLISHANTVYVLTLSLDT